MKATDYCLPTTDYSPMFRRWLLNIFAALSLLLMIGVVMLWVRSYWRWDWVDRAVQHVQGWSACELTSYSGLVVVGWTSGENPEQIGVRYPRFGWDWISDEASVGDPTPMLFEGTKRGGLHFYFGSDDQNWLSLGPVPVRAIAFPHLALLPPLMIAPLLWVRRWRRERRTRGGGFAVIAAAEETERRRD